ncbi:MAG TPA: hypothetical protein VGO62_12875, partial [Myxococcota bacterium]
MGASSELSSGVRTIGPGDVGLSLGGRDDANGALVTDASDARGGRISVSATRSRTTVAASASEKPAMEVPAFRPSGKRSVGGMGRVGS